MGLSASQGKLLSLTARISDLELQAQQICNQKLRLSSLSSDASDAYTAALDKQKLTVYNNNTTTHVDATLHNLTAYGVTGGKQKIVTDHAGRVMIPQDVAEAYQTAKNNNNFKPKQDFDTFVKLNGFVEDGKGGYIYNSSSYPDDCNTDQKRAAYGDEKLNYFQNLYTGAEKFLREEGYTSLPYKGGSLPNLEDDKSAISHYQHLFEQMDKNGYVVVSDAQMRDSEWLQSQISFGNIFLTEFDPKGGAEGKGGWRDISWQSGDATLNTVSDKTELARAEVEYEKTMKKIKDQDVRFDLKLQEINTEHSAIQTEMDSVKNVINKNIDRTFKTFS